MLVGLAAVVVTAGSGPAAAGTTTATAGQASAGLGGPAKSVAYRGLRFQVPASWPVRDLDAHPATCVRFDRAAVYLGTPGPDQHCPAHAAGRAEAVLVQPAAGVSGQPAGLVAAPSAAPSVAATAGESRQVRLALSGTGLAVTAAYADRPAVVDAVLATMHYDGPARPTPTAPRQQEPTPVPLDPRQLTTHPSAAAPDIPQGGTATRVRGRGFDTCAAPSADTMHAWKDSPYRTVGIYIGGLNRACPDGNLDAGWVRTVAKDGWRLLPIYVGRQAPCAFQRDLGSIRPSRAAEQGRAAAADAVERARHFGLYAGSALYFDMEGYDDRKTSCRKAVLTFLTAWTRRLHDSGYLSGVYSSAASGIKNLAGVYTSGTYARPDVIWTARWDGEATVWGERYLRGGQWGNHQRVKQYRGPHTEKWGGRRINIDSDVIDSALGSARYRYHVTAGVSLRARRGPATSYGALDTHPPGSTLWLMCQASGQRIHTSRVWDKLRDGTYVSDYYVSTPSSRGYSGRAPRCTYPYQVGADTLRRRAGPGTSYDKRGSIARGGLAYIVCQAKGQRISGSRVWDQLVGGSWVSDAYVATPGGPGYTDPIPRCR